MRSAVQRISVIEFNAIFVVETFLSKNVNQPTAGLKPCLRLSQAWLNSLLVILWLGIRVDGLKREFNVRQVLR